MSRTKVTITREELEEKWEPAYGRFFQHLVYSKVDTRSTVFITKAFNVQPDLDTEDTLTGILNTLMYVVRDNGQAVNKFNGMWGFSKHGQDPRHMTTKYVNLVNDCSNLRYYMGHNIDKIMGLRDAAAYNGLYEFILSLWILARTDLSDDAARSVATCFGNRKKPVEFLTSDEQAFNNCIGLIRSKRLRSFAQRVIPKGSNAQDLRGFIMSSNTCKSRASENMLMESVINSLENRYRSYNTFGCLFPHDIQSIDAFVAAFPQVKVQEEDMSYGCYHFSDAMRMYRKLSKQEKRLVHGKTVGTMHDSISDTYMRFTDPRLRASREKHLIGWKYKDEDMLLEDILLKAKTPLELSAIGLRMRICVGSYMPKVERRECVILNGWIHGHEVCLEVNRDRSKEEVSYVLMQAKMNCNAAVKQSIQVNEYIVKWAEDHNIKIHARHYDVMTKDDPFEIIPVPRLNPAIPF